MSTFLKELNLPFAVREFKGKVRDNYIFNEELILIVSTDRVSAFDCILNQTIPHKGQILNELSAFWLNQTKHICPNYLIDVPFANATLGKYCQPYPIEFVVRGYLSGHAWRLYSSGHRTICGVSLPDGLKMNDPLPEPILTPTTKSLIGHDVDVSEYEIIKSGLIPADEFAQLKYYAFELFKYGLEYSKSVGLILADTKYEFGSHDNQIYLIDEVHTPDSSRFFVLEEFEERQSKNEPQPQFSKEFLRQWLIANNFAGQENQSIPDLVPEIISELSARYQQVYELLTKKTFETKPCFELNENNLAKIIQSLDMKLD